MIRRKYIKYRKYSALYDLLRRLAESANTNPKFIRVLFTTNIFLRVSYNNFIMILLCSQWREFAWKCSQLINFEPRLGSRSSKGTTLIWWQMWNERVKSGKLDYHSRCSIPPMFFSFDVWFIQTRHTFDNFLNFVLEHVRVVRPWRLHLRVQHRRRRVENNRKRGQVYYRPGGYTS